METRKSTSSILQEYLLFHFVTIALRLNRKMTVESIYETTQRLLGNWRKLSRNRRIMHSTVSTWFNVSSANRIHRESAISHEYAHPIDGVVRERTWRKNYIARLANGIQRLVTATPEIAKAIRGIVVEAATAVQ